MLKVAVVFLAATVMVGQFDRGKALKCYTVCPAALGCTSYLKEELVDCSSLTTQVPPETSSTTPSGSSSTPTTSSSTPATSSSTPTTSSTTPSGSSSTPTTSSSTPATSSSTPTTTVSNTDSTQENANTNTVARFKRSIIDNIHALQFSGNGDPVCATVKIKHNNVVATGKGCATRTDNTCNSIKEKIESSEYEVLQCNTCSSDGCNGSATIAVNLAFTIFALAFVFVLNK